MRIYRARTRLLGVSRYRKRLLAASAVGLLAGTLTGAATVPAPPPVDGCHGLVDHGAVVRDQGAQEVRRALSSARVPVLLVVEPPVVAPSSASRTQEQADRLRDACLRHNAAQVIVVVVRAADGSVALSAPSAQQDVLRAWPASTARVQDAARHGDVAGAVTVAGQSVAVATRAPSALQRLVSAWSAQPGRAAARALAAGAVGGAALLAAASTVLRLRRRHRAGQLTGVDDRDGWALREDQWQLMLLHLREQVHGSARRGAPLPWSQTVEAFAAAEEFRCALDRRDAAWFAEHGPERGRRVHSLTRSATGAQAAAGGSSAAPVG